MWVTELWRYPVKSMRGERLDETVLTDDGVTGDRGGRPGSGGCGGPDGRL